MGVAAENDVMDGNYGELGIVIIGGLWLAIMGVCGWQLQRSCVWL